MQPARPGPGFSFPSEIRRRDPGPSDRIGPGPGQQAPGFANHPHAVTSLQDALELEAAWQRLPRAHRITINRALAAGKLPPGEWRHARRLVAWGVIHRGLTLADALRAVRGV